MKSFLFPRIFRTIGWILFIPTLAMGISLLFNLCSFSGQCEIIVNDMTICGIALGSLFITCSRERIEDEMTSTIRLRSLLSSLYTYVTLLIIMTLAVNGMAYLNVMVANLVFFPIIFTLRFRYEMHRYYKINDEK